ncbi:D-2-hydroxyacid dehydrogenase [Niveibacterium sp. 24ML]|uniref:D-2-hydroxyacid dehydrogenase n=1 Tax=Niveibacterium sp. 24ML TaxID=2985512 RepID=UPI00226E3CCE|nr:D-2-hydroxyacid dehydrogenase [Niveibacterium sp. 24ML]MCX9156991.1 D-2-hydroxyacid dehydrogenase [Niveibacterium sp. 24ML]
MSMRQVVSLESASLSVTIPRPNAPHVWVDHARTAPGEVVERLQGAEVALINKCRLDAAVLDQLPALRMISVCATGTDNVDLAACRARGIIVSNVRDYAVNAVPEHALMLMMALRRQLMAYVDDVRSGRWCAAPTFGLFDRPVADLHGASLAIVGFGGLGAGLARLAEALGMTVLKAERKGVASAREGYLPFTDALARADVVSLHCPLTAETRHLMGAAEFARMQPHAVLINTARGGLIDELALAHALRSGQIAGAALDVLSQEPPPRDHPLLAPDIPNLIITPHMAWASQSAVQRLADSAVAHIEAYLRGAPVSRVA